MTKNIICVACPMGCAITVEINDGGKIESIAGNTCKRGAAYAESECTNPVRSLTTTVKVSGGTRPVVPCKSAQALPKGKLLECAQYISKVEVKAPVQIGDVLVENILDTGIDIVATNHCPQK